MPWGLEDRVAEKLGGEFLGKVLLCLFFASEAMASQCRVPVCSLPTLRWLPWGWKKGPSECAEKG